MPILDMNSIIAYLFGIFLIYLCAWMFVKPFKWLLKLLINSLFGGLFLYIINTFGGFLGLQIGVNPFTAVSVGILGVPGVALLYLLKVML